MAYVIDFVEDAKYVRAVFTGEMPRKDHEVGRAEASLALKAHDRNRLLVDITRASPRISVADHFEFTSEHESLFPTGFRLAVIVRPGGSANSDSWKTFEAKDEQ